MTKKPTAKKILTMADILMGRDKKYPLTAEMRHNLVNLHTRVTKLISMVADAYGIDMDIIVTSGYRPGEFNRIKNAATASRHMTCRAVDLSDPQCLIGHRLKANYLQYDHHGILGQCGLWLEDPEYTRGNNGWMHLDIGTRRGMSHGVFIPELAA